MDTIEEKQCTYRKQVPKIAFTIQIEAELAQKFKDYCYLNHIKQQTLLNEIIYNFMKNSERYKQIMKEQKELIFKQL